MLLLLSFLETPELLLQVLPRVEGPEIEPKVSNVDTFALFGKYRFHLTSGLSSSSVFFCFPLCSSPTVILISVTMSPGRPGDGDGGRTTRTESGAELLLWPRLGEDDLKWQFPTFETDFQRKVRSNSSNLGGRGLGLMFGDSLGGGGGVGLIGSSWGGGGGGGGLL